MIKLLNPFFKILDFVVFSNLFISICVATFTIQTAVVFSKNSEEIFLFVPVNFIATFVLYNLQRLFYATQPSAGTKYVWYTNNRRLIFTLIILAVTCFYSSLWNLFSKNLYALAGYCVLASISVLYFLPPFQLRKYGVLKPFIISFVLVCVCVIIPTPNLNAIVIIYAIGQFCFVLSLCVLFDVRDIEYDREANIKTIPIKFGINKAKYSVSVLLLIYLVCMLFNGYFPVVVSLTIAIITLVLTFFAKPNNHMYYYLFFVDGVILLQSILVVFLNNT